MSKKTDAGVMRLDRLLVQEGLGTRSQVGKAVRSGRVLVNGAAEKDPGRRVTPEDQVLFDGKKVGQEAFVYYMLNKPAGVISATEDGRLRTVLDLLREPLPPGGTAAEGAKEQGKEESGPAPVLRRGLFPVGRLDRDTEGLLLITDDGEMAHRLLSPSRHVDKTYYAIVTGRVTRQDILAFARGLAVDDDLQAMPAELVCISGEDARQMQLPEDPAALLPAGTGEYTQTLVTIREGKYHQIKRMFAAVGKEVLYLRRLSMGTLRLDQALAPGQFRALTEDEIRELRSI